MIDEAKARAERHIPPITTDTDNEPATYEIQPGLVLTTNGRITQAHVDALEAWIAWRKDVEEARRLAEWHSLRTAQYIDNKDDANGYRFDR